MAEVINRGPSINLGPMIGTPISPEPYDGPGFDYQGSCIPDVRFSPANKDGLNAGRFPTLYGSPYFALTDQIPSTYSTTAIANTQPGTTTALTLVSACAGGGIVSSTQSYQCTAVVPFIPYQTGGNFPNSGTPVNVLALDFGYTVGTTTTGASSTTVTVPDVTWFELGQWICIGGAGAAGNTKALVAQITAITVTSAATSTQAGTITISPGAVAALTNAPIGNANFFGPVPAQGVATGVCPYFAAGVAACLNPTESLARALSYTAASGATATSVTVKGYDIYGQAMTETVNWSAGSTVYGKKAFKYVLSATLNATDGTHNYSIGTSDVYGIHVRSDKWEYTETFWNGGFNNANTGWTASVQKTASATTGDVRGTVQMGTIGGGSGYGSQSSNNSARFAMFLSMPMFNAVQATPLTAATMFGVNQF